MKINDIFLGGDSKLRSGWRFAVFAFGYLITAAILTAMLTPVVVSLEPNSLAIFMIGSLVGLVPALVNGWLCGKYMEGLPFRALGAWFTGGWFGHLVLGILIGAVTLCFAIAIASIFGILDFSLNTTDSSAIAQTLVSSLVVFGLAAAFEEALFRGYILQTFARSGLAWLAILMTSVFFGMVHLGNPNAGYLSSINTALAGVWFGVAYLKTRDLWFVWGMHWMWNWMQGAIFGVEVSGLTEIVHSPLLKETDGGPAWLTGGDYGIEASIACTIALIVSTVVIHFVPFLKADEAMLALTSEPPVVTGG
jgi:uncharacterized protein